MKDLAGRVAVVTGGGGGIGEALSLACAEAGMKVVVADIEADAALRVAARIRDGGGAALGALADVSDRDSVEALADACWKEFGGCHLLCNNAGVMVRGSIAESSEADWAWVLGVNVHGVLHGVRSFVPRMKEQGEAAHIVNTASIGGLTALPFISVYSASKYAVVAISEAMAVELADTPIGVSVLCPGGVDTAITSSQRNRPAALGGSATTEASGGTVKGTSQLEGAATRGVLDPRHVAQLVLEAVKAGDLYIFTHPGWRAAVAKRFDALDAAHRTAIERRQRLGF